MGQKHSIESKQQIKEKMTIKSQKESRKYFYNIIPKI